MASHVAPPFCFFEELVDFCTIFRLPLWDCRGLFVELGDFDPDPELDPNPHPIFPMQDPTVASWSLSSLS